MRPMGNGNGNTIGELLYANGMNLAVIRIGSATESKMTKLSSVENRRSTIRDANPITRGCRGTKIEAGAPRHEGTLVQLPLCGIVMTHDVHGGYI